MNLSADLREFIELLNFRGFEYVIVGAVRMRSPFTAAIAE